MTGSPDLPSRFVDLAAIRPGFERVLGAVRYFQASAVATMVVFLAMAAAFVFFLPPEIARGVATFLAETVASEPTTPAGYAMKFGAVASYFMPLFSILVAGALANLERPVSAIVCVLATGTVVFFAWLMTSLGDVYAQMPGSYFYIHRIAVPINLAVIGLVLWGVLSVWSLDARDRDALRDGFGQKPLRTLFLRLFGLPGYTLLLGARQWVVIPLFVLSSAFLASSLYPFLFAGAFANNLVRINRAECVVQGAARFSCFETAMKTDAILFPVYMGAGFTIPFLLYIATRRLARGLSITSMRKLMEVDRRAPVLFLRPFGNDQVLLPKPERASPFRLIRIGDEPKFLEHQVLEELTELGPVVAIGDRSKGRIPFGAARDYVPDEAWQGRVGGLIDGARAIVVVLNDTPGVWWEINAILSRGCVRKTLFILPPGSSSKADRLWSGLCEALTLHGISPPRRRSIGWMVVGLHLTGEGWQVGQSDRFTSTEALVLLRRFGSDLVVSKARAPTSPARYPFSLALLALCAIQFAPGHIFRDRPAQPAGAGAPSGWESFTVAGPGIPWSGGGHYAEALTPAPAGGEMVAAMRDSEGPPALLWMSPAGTIARIEDIRPGGTPAMERNALSPFALEWQDDRRIRAAVSVRRGKGVEVLLVDQTADGQEQRRLAVDPIPDLGRAVAGAFTEDGAFLLAGQVSLADGGMGPFVGGLRPDGSLAWSHRDFGAYGWSNDVALSEDGTAAFAMEIGREWVVLGIEASGRIVFRAPSPRSRAAGAASVIVRAGSAGWHVAGRVSQTAAPNDDSRLPVIAALGPSGDYAWITELPDLAGYFVQSMAHHRGRTYVALTSGSFADETSAVVIVDMAGRVVDTLLFAGSGARSIRTIGVASDGALWLIGLASGIPKNLPPIERMAIRSQPWIVRLTGPDET